MQRMQTKWDENKEPIKNWPDLLKAYDLFTPDKTGTRSRDWIFRGDKRSSLETSLERAVPNSMSRRKIEGELLCEFKRRLHQYISNVPDEDDTLEWLALMRHYGAPTRLLDWTYSFFVAAYFAIEDAKEDDPCVIYALRVDEFEGFTVLPKQDQMYVNERFQKYKEDNPVNDEKWLKRRALVDYLLEKPEPPQRIFAINPFRLNERLTIQQGLFTFPANISKSFEENLGARSVPRGSCKRLKISGEPIVRKEILHHLSRMNLSRATLFPGIQGFAESLKTLAAIREEAR